MPRILHIEDDPANRLLVRKLLQNAGFEVIDAADGLEGVRLAVGAPPDLVLVDLNIPGLDGYEVTLRLRAEASLAKIPIVAITAEGDRETSLAVGCDGFIQKPIDARSFATLVGRYLTGAREQSGTGEAQRLREQSQRIVAHLEEKIAELSQANVRLRDLDAAKSAFYRNVSHELATPMTPIVGYVKLLKDGELGPLTKAQEKALRSIDECVRRLRNTIDNLLDVTGIETGRMPFSNQEYDFLDTARRAVAAMADRIEAARLTLVEAFPRGPLLAWGDPQRLQRAITSLLDNAAKFTPAGGVVGVRVGLASQRPLRAGRGRHRPRHPARAHRAHLRRLLSSGRLPHAAVRRRRRGPGHRAPHGPGPRRGPARRFPGQRGDRGRGLPRRRVLAHRRSARPRPRPVIYLDWNATTPPHPEVLAAMADVAARVFANPASVHGPGRAARAVVEDAREAVAALLGFDPRDTLLTSGGTEANNLALASVLELGPHAALVVSAIEHPSVLRPAEALAAAGTRVLFVPPSPSGVVSAEAFAEALAEAARGGPVGLVSLQAVSHETGVLQPVAAVAELAHRAGARLHVDAVQAAGKLPPSAWEGADLVSFAAHKVRGPKGIGALATRPGSAPALRAARRSAGERPTPRHPGSGGRRRARRRGPARAELPRGLRGLRPPARCLRARAHRPRPASRSARRGERQRPARPPRQQPLVCGLAQRGAGRGPGSGGPGGLRRVGVFGGHGGAVGGDRRDGGSRPGSQRHSRQPRRRSLT
jgi:signal transduction histidine kinase